MLTPEERAARRQARRAATQADKAAWKEQVARHLGGLCEQYGFALTKVDSIVWVTSVEYASATTTLKVARSVEFNKVEAEVQRKPDWILPGQPIYITMNFTHAPVSMRELVHLRVPSREPELTALEGLTDEAIEGRLRLFAAVLTEYGQDLLAGDFSQLADQRVAWFTDRERVIMVWMPEGTDKTQRVAWMAEVQRQSPTIRVMYHTYQLKPKRQRQGSQGTAKSGPAAS
jgi:hypothetical protein